MGAFACIVVTADLEDFGSVAGIDVVTGRGACVASEDSEVRAGYAKG